MLEIRHRQRGLERSFGWRVQRIAVLVGELIFATNETGKTFIFKAGPDAFELIGENQLGNEVFATPAICGDRIFMRIADQNASRRQEMLYCIGKKE